MVALPSLALVRCRQQWELKSCFTPNGETAVYTTFDVQGNICAQFQGASVSSRVQIRVNIYVGRGARSDIEATCGLCFSPKSRIYIAFPERNIDCVYSNHQQLPSHAPPGSVFILHIHTYTYIPTL